MQKSPRLNVLCLEDSILVPSPGRDQDHISFESKREEINDCKQIDKGAD